MSVHGKQRDSRTLGDYLGLMARGFVMGSFEIVPGISGGMMALILGIYEELINSIKGVLNRDAIKLALQFKIKQALDLIPWKFLASLATGIFTAAFTMSFLVEWVLNNYPSFLWSFFFGLVAASIYTVSRRVKQWRGAPILGVVLGATAAYLIVGLVPVETPNTWWFFFLSGVIAICGMVLPGVSGSFVLVLLGKYERVLSAVTTGDILTLLLVVAGAAVGILTLAQLLSWLLKKHHDGTIAVLTGMLLGSLRKIWPWKEVIEFVVDRHGNPMPVREMNVLPSAWTWEVTGSLLVALLGFGLILGLRYLASHRERAAA